MTQTCQSIALKELHMDIDTRVNAIRNENSDWPCCRGCDTCCHRLAEIPQLTADEWDWLKEGITALPHDQFQEVCHGITTLAASDSRPLICPLLDLSTGACQVYPYRPVACRTYGFYVERDKGLYCRDLENQVASGTLTKVVWGNQDAIAHRLKGMGESRKLTDWFEDWIEIKIE